MFNFFLAFVEEIKEEEPEQPKEEKKATKGKKKGKKKEEKEEIPEFEKVNNGNSKYVISKKGYTIYFLAGTFVYFRNILNE